MPKLNVLSLSRCTQLSEVRLEGFDNLWTLDLSNNKKMIKLELKETPKLNRLDLSGCTSLPEVYL